MNRVSTLLGFLLLLTCSRQVIAQSESRPVASLRGRLLYPDGKPANDVKVEPVVWFADPNALSRAGLKQMPTAPVTLTDADGRFRIDYDPDLMRSMVIDVRSPGYIGLRWDSREFSRFTTRDGLDFGEQTLTRGASLHGRVLDKAGSVLGGTWSISVATAYRTPGVGGGTPMFNASVDMEKGTYRFDGSLPAGAVQLKLYSKLTGWVEGPRVNVDPDVDSGCDFVYGGPEFQGRVVVTCFTNPFYVKEPGAESLRLLGVPGEPPKPKPFGVQTWAFDDLPPGSYSIEIDDPRFKYWRKDGVKPGVAIDVHLAGGASVKLAVLDATTREPIEDYGLSHRFCGQGAHPQTVELRSLLGPVPSGGVYAGLLQGDHHLTIDAPGYSTAQVFVEGLAKDESRPVQALLTRGGTLSGTVVEGDEDRPAANVEVTCVAEFTVDELTRYAELSEMTRSQLAPEEPRKAKSGPDGSFRFTQLSNRTYRVSASRGPSSSVEQQAAIKSDSEASVKLVFPTTHRVSGRLRALPNTRFDRLRVGAVKRRTVLNESNVALPESTHEIKERFVSVGDVNFDGSFRLNGLEAGSYDLYMSLPDSNVRPDFNSTWGLFNEIHHLGEVSVPSVVRPPLEFDLGESSPSYLRVTVKVGGKLEKDLNVRFKNPFGGQIDVGGLTTPDGSVELGPVLPGMWLLDIFPIGPSWNYCWPDFVIVPPAASVKLDISIDLVKGVIQFVDRKTSAPLTGHWVMVKSQAGMGHTAGSTDAEGKIELNLPAGTKFYFSVTKPGESQPGGREYKKEVEWTATGPNPSVVKIRPSGS